MVTKGVFEPIDISKIPKGQELSKIYSSMFLKEKLNADGSLKKLKARLVSGGHMQDRNLYEESSIFLLLYLSRPCSWSLLWAPTKALLCTPSTSLGPT